MAYYLVQLAYTPDAWKALMATPQNRQDVVTPLVAELGGSFLNGKFLAFGEYDVVAIVELPDNVSAAAFAMAISASGDVKALKTTPLLLMATDGVQAMGRAGAASAKVRYRGPTGRP